MRTDLLVNDFVLRAVRDRFIVLFEADFKRNFCMFATRPTRFSMHAELRTREESALQRRAVGGKHLQARTVRGDTPAVAGVLCRESAVGQDPDKRDYIVSNAKIEAAGFKACRTIQDGIAELISAYQILPAQPFGNI